ncbi:cysteine proteinase [Fistulina hepatica ATCC 64428]|uniref:Cysteine proteinase n=1 Tax=Fistulina hepatica ATCC 64428 TaxID=1128425 RepID=A0A0D7A3S2_9AGAR|nr:cysteine proteinase [Fistulina hepatica ATCC 64428]
MESHSFTNNESGRLCGNRLIRKVPSQYSEEQVAKWLDHIGYPRTLLSSRFEANLENLQLLMRLQLLSFPFENTPLHYTKEHVVDVSPQGLYQRLVNQHKGFGSVCFGNNQLMLQMLRGLGYRWVRVYPGAARVNASDDASSVDFTSLQHQVLFVQPSLNGLETYMVDVGWGGSGLARPILLCDGCTVAGTAPPEEHRLVHGAHSESSVDYCFWRLQVRCGQHQPQWRTMYQFSETEFFAADFDVWNYVGAQRPPDGPLWRTNPFMAQVLCVRYFLTDDLGHMGRLVLSRDRVKRQIGDKSQVIRTLRNEWERIAALRELFGLAIEETDASYIQGLPSALVNSYEVRSRL